MSTPNLDLEKIQLTDNVKTSMLEKMNNNFEKIDAAYSKLSDLLLEKTSKETLAEAVNYVEKLVDAQDATITPDKVFEGYVGYNGLERIVGTIPNNASTVQNVVGIVSDDEYKFQIPNAGYYDTESYLVRNKNDVISDLGITPMPDGATIMPNVTVTLTGSNSTQKGYITGHGAGIDNNGTLVIWALSNSTAYEHVTFRNTSIGAGTVANGWGLTAFNASDPANVPYACTVTGLGSYSNIVVTLNVTGVNATNDWVGINVTLTAS